MKYSVIILYLVFITIGYFLLIVQRNNIIFSDKTSRPRRINHVVMYYEEETPKQKQIENIDTMKKLRQEAIITENIQTTKSVIEKKIVFGHSFDVTLTTQSTFNRFPFLSYLASRWTGQFSVAMFLLQSEQKAYEKALSSAQLENRVHITLFTSESNKEYPINKLRNIAIENVKTSHFWLADMDMWPSLGLREALMALPREQLEREDLAVIVPAFELSSGRNCGSFEVCGKMASRRVPNNKAQLVSCMQTKKCNTFRPKEKLHDYFFKEWYSEDYQPLLTKVTCFKGDTQEPYVMVKKTETLPRFNERFVNYGYNKVQWLEHLRYVGYDYQILTHGFAVDVPHSRSKYWSSFVSQLFGKVKEGEQRNIPMKEEYAKFKRELAKNGTSRQMVKRCS